MNHLQGKSKKNRHNKHASNPPQVLLVLDNYFFSTTKPYTQYIMSFHLPLFPPPRILLLVSKLTLYIEG